MTAEHARVALSTFLADISALMGLTHVIKPHVVVTDQGSQFMAVHFREFLESLQARHRPSSVYTPEQNAPIERIWGTTFGLVRTLLASANLPPDMHPPAVQFATWVLNRWPVFLRRLAFVEGISYTYRGRGTLRLSIPRLSRARVGRAGARKTRNRTAPTRHTELQKVQISRGAVGSQTPTPRFLGMAGTAVTVRPRRQAQSRAAGAAPDACIACGISLRAVDPHPGHPHAFLALEKTLTRRQNPRWGSNPRPSV